MRLRASLGQVLVAGLLHAASIAAPWNGQPQGWLQLLALSVLVWHLLAQTRPAHGAWLGWLFATAWLTGTFWWLFVAMYTYAGLPGWVAALAVLALAAALATYYALACLVFVAWAPTNRIAAASLFAVLWMMQSLILELRVSLLSWLLKV